MSLDGVSLQIKTFGKTFANYTSFLRIFETKFDFFSIGAGGGVGGKEDIFSEGHFRPRPHEYGYV